MEKAPNYELFVNYAFPAKQIGGNDQPDSFPAAAFP